MTFKKLLLALVSLLLIHPGVGMPLEQFLELTVNDELRQRALEKFINLEAGLQEIQEKLTDNTTNVLRICKISDEKLQGFKEIVEQKLLLLRATDQKIGDDLCVIQKGDNCLKYIRLLQCTLSHVRYGFIDATRSIVNLKELKAVKNIFDELSLMHEQELADVEYYLGKGSDKIITVLKSDMKNLRECLLEACNLVRDLIINLCSSDVYHGNVYDAIQNIKTADDNTILPQVITEAYHLMESFKTDLRNLFKFLDNLPTSGEQYRGYETFLHQEGNYNGLDAVKFAHKMQRMNLNELKNYFPTTVRNLVWNAETCVIRNKLRTNEYLYVQRDNNAVEVPSKRNVFSGVANRFENNWIIERTDDIGIFRIKSKLFTGYLQTEDQLDELSKKRGVFTFGDKPTKPSYWRILMTNDTRHFYVKSMLYNEFLVADTDFSGNDFNKRMLSTIKFSKDVAIPDKAMWQIDC